MAIFRNIREGIRNIIRWAPLIWRDRDWDYVFLLLMVEKKLKHMEELHREHGKGESSEDIANELFKVRYLVNKIASEDYEEEAFQGKEELVNKQQVHLINNQIVFSGLTPEEKVEYRRLRDYEDELLEQDIEELSHLMKTQYRRWWD